MESALALMYSQIILAKMVLTGEPTGNTYTITVTRTLSQYTVTTQTYVFQEYFR